MREIKFRGKYGNNPWLYGSLVTGNRNNNGIQERNSSAAILVDDGSIGQYTGVKDSNGKEVYEGDIVRIGCEGFEKIYVVVFDDSELDYKATNGKEEYGREFEYLKCCDKIEVIGNRWDNPDLLGGEHDEH